MKSLDQLDVFFSTSCDDRHKFHKQKRQKDGRLLGSNICFNLRLYVYHWKGMQELQSKSYSDMDINNLCVVLSI